MVLRGWGGWIFGFGDFLHADDADETDLHGFFSGLLRKLAMTKRYEEII